MSITVRRPTGAEADEPEAVPGKKKTRRSGKKPAEAAHATASTGSSKPSPRGEALTIGGQPRVGLLPPEVRASRRAKSTRRSLGFGVLAVALVMLLAAVAAFGFNVAAQARMLVAQSQTGTLVAQQQEFVGVRTVQAQVDVAQAAQQVGASTEIDWKKYLTQVQATLPGDVSMQKVTVDSSTPMAIYTQATVPLQPARVATLTFTASSPNIPQVPTWLRSLAGLPGYTDATPGTITLDKTTNQYTVNITMHINDAAFDKRFQPKGK
jgi:type IV pilus assembly protein PilN